MKRATFSPKAAKDVDGIWLTIAAESFDAAERWMQALRATADRLANESALLRGHRRREITRPDALCWTIGSYVIVYRFSATGISVIRVLHGARDFSQIDWR